MKTIKNIVLLSLFLFFLSPLTAEWKKVANLFNPKIGINLDVLVDGVLQENNSYSEGFQLRAIEIGFSAAIDPIASMSILALFTESGAELHEAFVTFPNIGAGFKLKGGQLFANFGRWNSFHVHALPFTSQPRVHRSYLGGFLLERGLELSWLSPFPFFLEVTFSFFDRFGADTHDVDPLPTHRLSSGIDVDALADVLGLTDKHGSGRGSHWHDPANGNIIVFYDEVVDRAISNGIDVSNDPRTVTRLDTIESFVYGGRIKTAFDIGNNFSLEWGASALIRHRELMSVRIGGQYYHKLVYGSDLTFFFHPLGQNYLWNMHWGVEMIGIHYGTDYIDEQGRIIMAELNRIGFFLWWHIQVSPNWRFGFFSDIFEKNHPLYANTFNGRYGTYLTWQLSHFQYLRLEYSFYHYPDEIENTHRIILQYNGTIGFHSHGTQR